MPDSIPSPTSPPEPEYDRPKYDRDAIFLLDGPINPTFISESIRTIMRALPIGDAEPTAWAHRRMFSAMLALSALNPRDEIEIMLGVQALSAYHAAAACWRIGMNHHRPNGDSTRHITAAGTAARTFDSMLRALERRQAKPLFIPVGRPPARIWPVTDPTHYVQALEHRCRQIDTTPATEPEPEITWTPEDLALADALLEQQRIEKENEGLDIANTEGILPGGGMIVMDDPTLQQEAYMGRRLGLMYRREYEENLRNGIRQIPKIRAVRTGDLIP